MQGFLNSVRDRVSRFMYGRYGGDQLGMTLVVASVVCTVVASLAGWRWLSLLSIVLVLVELWRMLSRDHAARSNENQAFLSAVATPRAWVRRQQGKWANRKTKAYVRCPHCHAEFALPKGKGRLRATCPKCGQKSEHTV